jgi:hypothetical protein
MYERTLYERAALRNHSKPPGKPMLPWFTMVLAPAWFSNGFERFTNGLQDIEPSALISEAGHHGHEAWPVDMQLQSYWREFSEK